MTKRSTDLRKKTRFLAGLEAITWKPTAPEKKELEEFFPLIHPQHGVYGDRVIFQLRSPREKSKGGIILTGDSQDAQKWNEQIARVIAIGPTAFHFQKDLKEWPEGDWFDVGDFVRVPMYGSERWEVPYTIDHESFKEEKKAIFVIRRAHEVIAPVFGNPLNIKTYV